MNNILFSSLSLSNTFKPANPGWETESSAISATTLIFVVVCVKRRLINRLLHLLYLLTQSKL